MGCADTDTPIDVHARIYLGTTNGMHTHGAML